MPYVAIIGSVISTGLKLLSSSGGPSYPSAPQILGLPVQEAKNFMQDYEGRRMDASINAWKNRFPLLYKGGQYQISDIGQNQKGFLSDTTKASIGNAGLEMPKEGDQYKLAKDLGMNPITLSQRTSMAYNRQIANNPEWTSKISGGTLASMIANNNKNQNAFTQFLGAQNAQNFNTRAQATAYNTSAIIGGALGAAQIGARVYQNNQYSPLSPVGQGSYQYQASQPNYSYPSQPASSTPTQFQAAPNYDTTNMWNNPSYMPYSYLGNQDPGSNPDIWSGNTGFGGTSY